MLVETFAELLRRGLNSSEYCLNDYKVLGIQKFGEPSVINSVPYDDLIALTKQ